MGIPGTASSSWGGEDVPYFIVASLSELSGKLLQIILEKRIVMSRLSSSGTSAIKARKVERKRACYVSA